MKFDSIDGLYTYLSPHMEYFSKQHAVYASVAMACGLFITIGFPFLILIEPIMLKLLNKLLSKRATKHIKRFMEKRNCFIKIKLLLLKLQDCYKDQYRRFAAYYLICQLVIMLITYFANNDYNNMMYYLQTACIIIVMTHIWIQPYKNDALNLLDTAILSVMLLIVNLSAFDFPTSKAEVVVISFVIAPMFLLIIVKTFKMLKNPLSFLAKSMKRLSRQLFKQLQQQNRQRNIP